ncbi:MAG: hypothetical protein HN790_15740 [Methylococcales bacterium]|jgi:hypothetical protein|nr:hypothetical protein [Methylococcales bacterium]
MTKSIKLLLILASSIGITACNDNPDAGIYYHSDNKDQYIELKDDHHFVLFKQGNKMEGEYTVENGQLKLLVIIPDNASIKDNMITDSSGETWLKPSL